MGYLFIADNDCVLNNGCLDKPFKWEGMNLTQYINNF